MNTYTEVQPRRHGQLDKARMLRVPIGSMLCLINDRHNDRVLVRLLELQERRFVYRVVLVKYGHGVISHLDTTSSGYYSDNGIEPYPITGVWNNVNWVRVESLAKRPKPKPDPKLIIRWQEAGF